jgi:hypothetical protein
MWSILTSREKNIVKKKFGHITQLAAMPIYGQNLKKSSRQKRLVGFSIFFTGMILKGSPKKVVQENLFRRKTWPQELFELCMFIRFCIFCENFENLLVHNHKA